MYFLIICAFIIHQKANQLLYELLFPLKRYAYVRELVNISIIMLPSCGHI